MRTLTASMNLLKSYFRLRHSDKKISIYNISAAEPCDGYSWPVSTTLIASPVLAAPVSAILTLPFHLLLRPQTMVLLTPFCWVLVVVLVELS